MKWNPRFVAFARAHGRTPEEQDAVDRAGSHKMEFILWNTAKIREFCRLRGVHPDSVDAYRLLEASDEYDQWLAKETL